MKSRLCSLFVALACACVAADYPASAGYVNDFTGILPGAVQDALDLRLRAYERATSNEVAVAVVSSLQGESVEDFARGLFRAWGLGKQGDNNGVLFLWAPSERKVRIQVGYGLEKALSDSDCVEILARVTPLFRDGSYSQGVQAAVDGILQRLGQGAAAAVPLAMERHGSQLPVEVLVAAVLALAVLLLAMHYHTTRAHRLQLEVPAEIARCQTSLQAMDAKQAGAEPDLAELQSQSPLEVWGPWRSALDAAPQALAELRGELGRIQSLRREEYRELTGAWRALRRWRHKLEKVETTLSGVRRVLDNYLQAQAEALDRIPRIPGALSLAGAQVAHGRNPQRSQMLLDAAQTTFDKVRELRQDPPVNWLLLCDLLSDTQACLDHIGGLKAQPFARCWPGSEKHSQAHARLRSVSYAESSGGYYAGGQDTGGASSGASFGGGDTGSGGASASY
jgi:uncharacterized protein